jgi:hypothetical protein
MAFLLLVASTHYVVMWHKNQKVYKDIQDVPAEGGHKLFNLVQEAHGGLPIFWIKPSHMTTMDGTVT